MPLAAADVVKLGNDVMQLAAVVIVANNIMTLAAAAQLTAAATAVAKRAANCVPPCHCRRRGRLSEGMLSHCPGLPIRGSSSVNKEYCR